MREDCVESSKQLRSLRETHKMTQSDMAAAAECSLRNYQNYEYGKSQPGYIILSHKTGKLRNETSLNSPFISRHGLIRIKILEDNPIQVSKQLPSRESLLP